MSTIHLPVTAGHKWAKMNQETQLLEFFTCVDSGYYKESDYELVTDDFMEQYIDEMYPKPEPSPYEEENGGETPDSSAEPLLDPSSLPGAEVISYPCTEEELHAVTNDGDLDGMVGYYMMEPTTEPATDASADASINE